MQRRELLRSSLLIACSITGASVARAMEAGVTAESDVAKAIFTTRQRKSVSLLSEMIIPTTDTPGAIDAGVPAFIEVIVGEWYRPAERKIFLQGLDALDAYSRKHGGDAFLESTADVRVAALRASETAAADYSPPTAGGRLNMAGGGDENTPFFTKLKELVVLGYYTSEVGAKQELAYNPVPGDFDGDYDFEKIGRQWSY